ncbi:MAG: discoidin domain-containing protein, partial [Planctomycetes bacterium]|nr:discoidin domain-containing protein [Planctomycetota bacterium]
EHEDFGYINKTLPYAHGFSKTCPADPPYTEASLQTWMTENKKRYTLAGTIDTYYSYMRTMQQWARNFQGKHSSNKHGSTVADHSVFCRRTPFMHVALAEAQWNPDGDTEGRVDAMVDFLKIRTQFQSTKEATIQHEATGKTVTLQNQYSRKYTAGGAKGLVDGKVSGSNTVDERCWQGYEGQDLEAVIDLGSVQSIRSLSSSYLQSIGAGVFLPRQVQYALSNDGKNFTMAGTVECDVPQTQKEAVRRQYSPQGLDLDGRYVRVKALS